MKKLFFIALLLLSLCSQAQVRLSISPHFTSIYGSLDTMAENSTDSISVMVFNTGASAFTGSFTIGVGVRDSANASLVDSIPVSTGTITTTLVPGDSMQTGYTTYYHFSSGGYRNGIDVIVVWPVALSGTPVYWRDSAEFSIMLYPVTGVGQLDLQQALKLYPNPVCDRVTISGGNASVESAMIYDLSGKAVLRSRRESCIDVQLLPPGTYIVNVLLSNKKQYILKFIKQKSIAE